MVLPPGVVADSNVQMNTYRSDGSKPDPSANMVMQLIRDLTHTNDKNKLQAAQELSENFEASAGCRRNVDIFIKQSI